MNTKKPKMLVISLDAVGSGDIEKAMELPGFARFFDGASRCMSVHSVYPSITYPAHTSIVTGRYPVHHGIVDNTKIQPNRKSPDWYWQRKYIRGTTLYDEALKRYRDYKNTIDYAEEKGLEKGIRIGEAKGKAEEQRLIAANLKKQGINIETIAQCTGLSIEEINEL